MRTTEMPNPDPSDNGIFTITSLYNYCAMEEATKQLFSGNSLTYSIPAYSSSKIEDAKSTDTNLDPFFGKHIREAVNIIKNWK